MRLRKLLAALFMFGVIVLGIMYSVNKTRTDIPHPVDTDITFPLEDET